MPGTNGKWAAAPTDDMAASNARAEQKVFVVDDDSAVRQSLAWLLGSIQLRTECFASAAEFLARRHPGMRGCLILDLRMPEMSGLELQEALLHVGSKMPIIFVTGHGEVDSAVQALKSGAFDFVEKPFNENRLLERVHAALAWEAEAWQKEIAQAALRTRFARCTERELQVLRLLLGGGSNKQIASDLSISVKTVEVHRARLMEKAGASSFAELVRLALALDAVAPE